MRRLLGDLEFTLATESELSLIRQSDLGDGEPADTIDKWHLVSVHHRRGTFQVFALGKVGSRKLWISTPPLVALEKLVRVRTTAGTLLLLGEEADHTSRYLPHVVRRTLTEAGFIR